MREWHDKASAWLQRLVSTQSFSREESATADLLQEILHEHGIESRRIGNNVLASAPSTASPDAPTLILNSHHDTVRPGASWTRDPFAADIVDGRLYGVGSNDAGGALVTMLATFLHLCARTDLPCNVMFIATAEEEVSGDNGMAAVVRALDLDTDKPLVNVGLVLVGEPTGMNMAIAERGLMVLECTAHGATGHAARQTGVNAIYEAMRDIEWFRTARIGEDSATLGPVTMTVTQINAGSQHNVVPDRCHYVVDVRTTDIITNERALDLIRAHVASDVVPRSMRLRPSRIDLGHPIIGVARDMLIPMFGSPTMSDQALLPAHIPSVKIGPGLSERSHTPDEYIEVREVHDGIDMMIALCERYLHTASGG
jgi:acetylornithine deacetylase